MKWYVRRFYEMAEKRSGSRSIQLFPKDSVLSMSKRLSAFIREKETHDMNAEINRMTGGLK